MIFLKISAVFIVLTGCTAPSPLSPFPSPPNLKKYESDPVLSINNNGNYIVTPELVENAAKNHVYIESVLEWRAINRIP